MLLVVEQLLNGVQLGVMLFLLAAGLTLVLGIMDLVNLAHGSLYMIGAFIAASVARLTGSFLLGLVVALPATALVGIVVEVIVLRRLYQRNHLDQVLATFGMILFFNELVRILWGPRALFLDIPRWLSFTVEILPGAPYPAYRLAIILVGLLVGLFLYLLTSRTRLGMLIRAGASNREMVGALAVNINWLYTLVFGIGAMLAALAG
ncbi:MAG: branched-chain amino acid ABC transporter permease, partial [Kiloniellales bacterium]|nr:branched-chain amino acid ABC transporter permease [Kiloniellales bacterium]